MGNVTEEKWIEMLEKKSDGNYIVKYPKVKSKSGVTFDEHLADSMPHRFADGDKVYKYGFSVIDGVVTMNYEEVVE